ncbi:PTS transporter subunit EIIC [Borrelia anserina]|uniref:Pts system, glucose-specific iiabc component n=2 Tax=Borrelia anserina TaxID=143 RepID=W5SN72_BORAN|nr:PTS transporter subunit EIIC [Borrelia anserina]AHH08078.1 Pts system, glucose-specific iiabc component [Borrelia anserina BA2]AHH08915.1 Pts system, glucose-specific iiabc component [Borrelia anserina BA2]APR64624.1 PTS mannose transporter subunit IIB [Borrelia anserina Es]UPA06538.1 PTS transporter subunit EIIC [Borrelia anserina]
MIDAFKVLRFASLQKFSNAVRLPISVLTIFCLMLGIGSALSNPSNLFYIDNIGFKVILGLIKNIGNIIIVNIPLLFVIGIAIGVSRVQKGPAALSGLIGYLIFNITENYFLDMFSELAEPNLMSSVGQVNILGIQTLNTGIFGALAVGLLVGYLHNKFYFIELPGPFSFLSGVRFVPIIIFPFCVLLGITFVLVWPYFNGLITFLGFFIAKFNYFDSFLYGFLNRIFIPLGLHSILAFPFNFTSLGGTEFVNGQVVGGVQNIFYAQLSDPYLTRFSSSISRFNSGFYLSIMFGLPGAVFGVYRGIIHDDKSKIFPLLFSGAFAAFLTGITEPLEFLFVFTAPLLYFIHAVYTGFALLIANVFDIAVGMTFSAGFFDVFMFGILQGHDKTNWIYLLPLGVAFFILYYFTFKWVYNYFDFQIFNIDEPFFTGIEGEVEGIGIAHLVVQGLGGLDNIQEFGVISTDLSFMVFSPELISEDLLKKAGALNIVLVDNTIKIDYGANVNYIRRAIENYSPEKLFKASVVVASDSVKQGIKAYIEMKEDDKLEKQGVTGKLYKLNKDDEDN